jgi:hypothetical protein
VPQGRAAGREGLCGGLQGPRELRRAPPGLRRLAAGAASPGCPRAARAPRLAHASCRAARRPAAALATSRSLPPPLPQFKTFFQCMIKHNDYYEPFLEMFGLAADGQPKDEEGGEGESSSGAAPAPAAGEQQQPGAEQQRAQPPASEEQQ